MYYIKAYRQDGEQVAGGRVPAKSAYDAVCQFVCRTRLDRWTNRLEVENEHGEWTYELSKGGTWFLTDSN